MFNFQYHFIKKRIYGPIVWNLIFQATLLNAFTFFVNADLLNPLHWFYKWYVDFIWRGYFLYIIPLTFIVVTQGCVCIEDYTTTQPFYATRWSLIQQVLSLHNIILCLLHITIGFLIPWIYSSLAGEEYVSFFYECYSEKGTVCFSEKKLFLVFGGMVVNCVYFCQTHFLGTRYLTFPLAQLPKITLIKGFLLKTFQESVKWVFFPTIAFVILYYFRGGLITNTLCIIFSCNLETKRLDSVMGLVNIKLFFYLFLFSSIVVISMKIMELFFKASLTEHFIFPTSTTENHSLSLCEGLQRSDCPIVQHLAFLDLMLLSQHSKPRREEIFRLSDFGGHPLLWNNIKKECLATIQEFSDSLEENLKLPSQPKEPSKPVRPPEVKRNVTNYFLQETKDKNLNVSMKMEEREIPQQGYVFRLSETQKERITNIPILLYFFGDRKDMRIRHTLKQNLPVIWACEALSFLCCHSVTEDKYGILVNDVPQIIMNLLRLKWILDTLLKQSIMAGTLGRQDVLNTIRGTAMKKSVKRSIYIIVKTFRHYINDLQLTKETEAQLLPYLTYKE